MSWKKTNIVPPIPPEVQGLADNLSSTLDTLAPLLDAAISLLEIAKVLYNVVADPYAGILGAVITSLENLVNDYFGSGVHQFVIDPFSASNRIRPVRKYRTDRWGIPYVTPGDAINYAVLSLDDTGDENRPQYSNATEVSGFGFMLSAIDIEVLVDLVEQLLKVWSIDDLKFTTRKVQRITQSTPPSRPPDWQATKFNQIEQIADLQREILKLLGKARGYLVTADNVVDDLIDLLTRKVEQLKASVEALSAILQALTLIGQMNDVWAFDLAKGPGGNERIKRELQDDTLSGMRLNKYTVMLLYVGGAGSATGVDNIRKLVVG